MVVILSPQSVVVGEAIAPADLGPIELYEPCPDCAGENPLSFIFCQNCGHLLPALAR